MRESRETTSLLRPELDRDDDAVDSSSHPVKMPSNGADIEANGVHPDTTDPNKISTSSLMKVISVLLIGLAASNIDSSLVLATHPRIASEFNALNDSSWIFVSFLLGGVVTQVLYAKLSDVYGRMAMLVFCYGLFGIGCTIIFSGLSKSMGALILGRVISGSGGAGMAGLAQVIITDFIPLREVASWLGYINIVSTTARSIGGPLGGFLADRVGWRWSFLGQAPPFAIAMMASIRIIPNRKAAASETPDTSSGYCSRIDLAGSLLLGTSILLFILPLEIGGAKVPWTHPVIYTLFATGIVSFILFVVNESRWASNPAFPLRLMKHRDILCSYMSITCIAGAQTSLMYLVPLYFQVTTTASTTIVGLHLVPAVVGNAFGGLVSGHFIRRTGGYKAAIIGSSIFASIGYALLIARWRGHTNHWESMYIFLGGFGSGMASSAVFVSLTAVVEPAHKAVVTSLFQLTMPIGMLLGVAAASAVMVQVLRSRLEDKLMGLGMGLERREEIIAQAIANVDYIHRLPEAIGEVVVGGYVSALRASFVVILAFSLMGLVAGSFLRERRL